MPYNFFLRSRRLFWICFLSFLIGTLVGQIPLKMKSANDDEISYTTVSGIKDENVKSNCSLDAFANTQASQSISVETHRLLKETARQHEKQSLAAMLEKHVRILCMVLATARFHQSKEIYVKQTWGRKCTKLVFLSDAVDVNLPALNMTNDPRKGRLWAKTRAGFQWAYDNHLHDFDWFLKADDDTFVVMENLRALLAQYNHSQPVYVGHEVGRPDWQNPSSYNQGGAGYALNRMAVVQLVEQVFPNGQLCARKTAVPPEDKGMGICLENAGVSTADSRDDLGRQRFLPLQPSTYLNKNGRNNWYPIVDKYTFTVGPTCCSNIAVSFHKITPVEMLRIEYLINKLHVLGRNVYRNSTAIGITYKQACDMMYKTLETNGYII